MVGAIDVLMGRRISERISSDLRFVRLPSAGWFVLKVGGV